MKILINTPDINLKGGVANMYRMLYPHIEDKAELFFVGSSGGVCKKLFMMFIQIVLFTKKIYFSNYKVVIINPSLGITAVWRDAIYIQISKMFRRKVVCFIHGWDWDYSEQLEKKSVTRFRSYYSRCDVILVLANEFKQKLEKWGVDTVICTITTAVEDDFFKKVDAREVQKKDKPYNILYLSRVEKEKGIFEAIRAYNILRGKGINCLLTVAGDGAALNEAKLMVLNEQVLDVEFLGYVRGQDKYKLFCEADYFLFPTYYEGMPVALLEAMAAGLPVISRPVGGIPDFFENGIMGYITDSKDPSVFADIIEKLIVDKKLSQSISEFNRCYAERHFKASKVATIILSTCARVTL